MSENNYTSMTHNAMKIELTNLSVMRFLNHGFITFWLKPWSLTTICVGLCLAVVNNPSRHIECFQSEKIIPISDWSCCYSSIHASLQQQSLFTVAASSSLLIIKPSASLSVTEAHCEILGKLTPLLQVGKINEWDFAVILWVIQHLCPLTHSQSQKNFAEHKGIFREFIFLWQQQHFPTLYIYIYFFVILQM